MRSLRRAQAANDRSLPGVLFKVLCLSLLPAFAWAQALLPCPSETQEQFVATADDAAILATSLQCSNGSFTVRWFGDILVSQTINITQGTSLNITGATTDATADGNQATQLFAVDGASSLHVMDMVLANGDADFGGAIHATGQSSVSFGGNMTFASNTASYGGAIYAGSSTTVQWDGEDTMFLDNNASYYGGAIMVEGSSNVSWDGATVFANNSAKFGGGAVFLGESSEMSWSRKTTFTENTAWYGGGIHAKSSAVVWGGDDTTFSNNQAKHYGGALLVIGLSSVSWNSSTVFSNNSASDLGGAVFANESSSLSWSSKTIFTENTAWSGGAMYADSSSVISWDGGDTQFSNNNASYYGGAVTVERSSFVSWGCQTASIGNSKPCCECAPFANASSKMSGGGKTTFTANTATYGGAIYAYSSSVIWQGEDTIFSNNYANKDGGAITAETSSSVSWDGETVFMNNEADCYGGAVFVKGYSNASWEGVSTFLNNSAENGGGVMVQSWSTLLFDGDTVFMNNNAGFWGGGLYVMWISDAVWTGNTTFQNNSAIAGGGVFIFGSSVASWSGTTTFVRNTAPGTGGGLDVHTNCSASWTGVTTFMGNFADRAGAIFLWDSTIAWTGNTTFSNNVAYLDGGAVYGTVNSNIFCQGTTIFVNNTAETGNAGALGIYGYLSDEGSYVDISGETTFANNSASANGGAIFSSANNDGQYVEGATFLSNSAGIGGAVATFGTGNGNELEASPTVFLRCQFLHNTATETGGAVETAFGQAAIVSSHFEDNSADVGGALRIGGAATIHECSFVSNMASSSGLAVSAVGSVEINGSYFVGNVFSCEQGEFLEELLEEGSSTPRYQRVCVGCPTWNECDNCTVDNSNSDPTCSTALEHTSANQAGSTLETLSVDSGFWRATTDSAIILACYNQAACRGGQTGGETFCDNGYMGPYCSVCQSGYSPSLSSTCSRCSPSRRQWVMAFTVIAVAIVGFAVAAFAAYLVSTNFDDQRSIYIHRIILRAVPLQAFKIIVVVWQILTQFASVANVTYPGVYQAFLSVLNIINLDLGFVMSAGCLWLGIDFHDRLLVGTIWPLSALGLLAMTYAVALRRNAGCGDNILGKIRNKHLSAVLLLLFFVYSTVSSTVFRMFACDSLDDGETYLRADYRILCTDAKHRALQVYAAIMIGVYPVGIPLLFVIVLYMNRDVLSNSGADKAAAESISSLWAPYRPSRFYYEVVECGRRVMMTGVVVFIYPNDTAQIAITIINSFFFFVVSEVLSPYQSESDTWLSRSGHVLIFFSMFDVLLLRVDVSQESSQSQQVLGGVLVAGHVVMIIAVVAEAIGLCYASRGGGGSVIEEPVRPGMPFGLEE